MRALPLLLLPALALAQTESLVLPLAPPRGVTLPPTSAALVDEATALSLNPAGLRFVGPSQLFFLHERNPAQDLVGNGLFLGGTLLGRLGTGASVEWIRGRGQPDYRKTSFGLALGSDTLALGGAYHAYSSEHADLERLSSFDVGLSYRPARALSLGAVVRDVDAPEVSGLALPRRYDLALGLRPFGERYTLGTAYAFTEDTWREGRLTWTLQATLLPGLRLGAGLSHGLRPGHETVLQLAATLDTSRLGLTYAGGGASIEGAGHLVALRLSRERYPALSFSDGLVALVDLDDRLVEPVSPVLSLLGVSAADPFIGLLEELELAARDPRLRGVLLKVEQLPEELEWARAEELRQAVLRLRAAGKRVMALLYSVDDLGYFIGSAADEVYALPGSMLTVNGLSASVTFVGGTMEKLGVTWEVARVGDYKSAMDQLTRRDMSPAQRETLEAYLDAQANHYVAAVAASRKLTAERVREAWNAGILTPQRARELGLVDDVLLPERLDEKVKALVPGARFEPSYSPRNERTSRWGSRRRIAVVPVVGVISGGKSRETPLGTSRVAGLETVARALEQARSDPSVVAIVVRVDSGGGDVLASELMLRAVLEARRSKPLVASMGDVAASGGYYAAMGAHEIYASPTTLTGSIGVFYPKPALQGLGEKLGVKRETLKRGPLADLLEPWRPWTDEERTAVQAWVDAAYDDFLTQVAATRKLDKAAVDAVARGRVWSGAAAREHGLVDALGGLREALEAARRRAHVPPEEELELLVLGEPHGLLASLGGEPGVLAELVPSSGAGVPAGVQALLRELGLEAPWMLEPGLKALQPFSLSLR